MDIDETPGSDPSGSRPGRDETESNGDNFEPGSVPIRDRRKLHSKSPDEATEKGSEAVPPELDDLGKAKSEAAAYLDDLKRLKAEFDNYRKRVLKEQTLLVETAALGVISRLISVMDNFELAVAAAEQTNDFQTMLKGVEMVYGELKEVLKAEGLEVIEAKGRSFDPNIHEAALEIPGDGSGNAVVGEVLRPGYSLKGRVIRPAMVKVTQKASGD